MIALFLGVHQLRLENLDRPHISLGNASSCYFGDNASTLVSNSPLISSSVVRFVQFTVNRKSRIIYVLCSHGHSLNDERYKF